MVLTTLSLDLRDSATNIEDLRCEFGEDINFINFGNSVTLLVQQLKKNVFTKIVQ